MKRVTALIIWLIVFVIPLQVKGGNPMKEVGSISGSALNVIHSAIPKFSEHGLKLEEYVVSVFETESSFLVLFDDPKRSDGQRGSTTAVIGFEVEVSKAGLQVTRANFVR